MYENIYSEHKFSTVGISVNQTFINLSTYNVVCYENRLLHMHDAMNRQKSTQSIARQ